MNEIDISKAKILMVDDNPQNLKILGTTLAKHKFTLALAKSGQMALDTVAKFKPDLILLDVNMPEMDGFEVCRRLKSSDDTKAIPVIFITALSDSEDIVNGFEVGGVDYVTKPFNPSELIQRVKTHLKLKKSSDIINSQKDKLEEMNNSKNQFFSILAHDLRGPFHGCLQLVKLIDENQDMFDKEAILDIVSKIHVAQSKQVDLVESLLDWSRIESGKIDYNPMVLQFKSIFEDLSALYKQNIEAKKLTIKISVGTETIIADKFMFNTTIRNLLNNAIKFTPEGGNIELISKLDKKGDNYLISVKDNGVGMKPEDLGNIFRIDVHSTKVGTGKEKGSGLGLKLCKGFVEKHNGKIWVESELGIGTEFIFSIPTDIKSI